jgi:hypothetical protein
MPLFLVSYVGLMILSVAETDFSDLLPIFSDKSGVLKGIPLSFNYFSDAALFLPLLGSYRYKQGDGKKIMLSYALGGAFVLFFLAVFYGIFGVISPAQKNAFMQTAKYFSALPVIGRFDLLLGYLMTIVLLFAACVPIQLSVSCLAEVFQTERKPLLSIVINVPLLLFTCLCSRYYSKIEFFIERRLFFIFPLFHLLLPLLALLLLLKQSKKGKSRGQGSDERKNTSQNKEAHHA